MIAVPDAPAGRSKANGVGGFTGTRLVVGDVEQVEERRPLPRAAARRSATGRRSTTGAGLRRRRAARSFLFGSVATSISRMPPRVGAGNSCDSRCSPSTSAVALTVAPAVPVMKSLNSARPFSSVFTVMTFGPTCRSTGWPVMLFDSEPRIRRTEIAPFGRSSTGRGMPDICFGSGIAKPPRCARCGRHKGRRGNKGRRGQTAPSCPSRLVPTCARSSQSCARSSCRTWRRRRSSVAHEAQTPLG